MGFFDKITKKHNEGEAFTPEEERTQQHSDIAVGLDIGTTKIVAFAGKRNHAYIKRIPSRYSGRCRRFCK